MNQTSISRRALIGGLSVAAVAFTVPSSGAVSAGSGFSSEWHALIANYRRVNDNAKAACDCFNAAERAYVEQRQPEPARKHRSSRITENMTIAQIKAMPGDLFGDDDTDLVRWRAEDVALRLRIVDPANDAWSAALSDADAAMAAVQAYPSVSPAMLAEKLCLLAEHYGDSWADDKDALASAIADARRLTNREG